MREAAGLSRAEVARKAAVPAGTLRHWEGGRGMPGLPALLRLAKALGVCVERFAEGVEDPEPAEPPAPIAPRGRPRKGEGKPPGDYACTGAANGSRASGGNCRQ